MISKKVSDQIRLSIIIVSYNTEKLLERCLRSVFAVLKSDDYSQFSEVIVVDNNSSDGSVSMVRDRFAGVKLIEKEKNLGFAGANNQGLVLSKGKFLLLLNSDAELTVGALKIMITDLYNNEHLGVVGPKLLYKDNKHQQSAGYLPDLPQIINWMLFIDDLPFIGNILKPYHLTSPGFYNKGLIVGWVSGACFLIRKETVDKCGMLDEKIFMYGEEVEWCYRIKEKGMQVYLDPNAIVYHDKGGSGRGEYSGILEEFATLQHIYHKHKPFLAQKILNLILRLGALLRVVIFGIIGRNSIKKAIYAKAYKLV